MRTYREEKRAYSEHIYVYCMQFSTMDSNLFLQDESSRRRAVYITYGVAFVREWLEEGWVPMPSISLRQFLRSSSWTEKETRIGRLSASHRRRRPRDSLKRVHCCVSLRPFRHESIEPFANARASFVRTGDLPNALRKEAMAKLPGDDELFSRKEKKKN